MSEQQEQDIEMLEIVLRTKQHTNVYADYEFSVSAIQRLLDRIRELEQQRDAALKLADKWEQYAENFREQSKDWLASLPKNVDPPSYIHDECAADLRAIFEPKEGK